MPNPAVKPIPGAIRAELRCARSDELRAHKRLHDAVALARKWGWTYDQIADAADMPRWMVRERFRD